jgi:hypothetical protein
VTHAQTSTDTLVQRTLEPIVRSGRDEVFIGRSRRMALNAGGAGVVDIGAAAQKCRISVRP